MTKLTFNGKSIQLNGTSLIIQPEPPTPIVDVDVKYGYLYNYYTITDVRYISNVGWHVPIQSEWQSLINYFGGDVVDAGNALLDDDSTYWQYLSGGITNSAKFNFRGAGYRSGNGGFSNIRLETYLNTSTDAGSGKNTRWNQPGDQYMNFAAFQPRDYTEGGPIRLIKDSTTLSNGQEGSYIGNDGKRVRTICIGNQEWLADNLAETKYRNDDEIPTVTGTTDWANLSSGAKCAYGNTESNVLL